ncbi:MAG: hypothetical protein WAV56_05220 [Microgenomates group bacterium]
MIETGRLSEEEERTRIDRDRAIDGFFGRLAEGEAPPANELDVEYLKQLLTEAGANLEPERRGEAVESLAKKKYTEKHPNRRLGCQIVWDHDGEAVVTDYEGWAQEQSAMTCPRFKNEKTDEPIEGSQSRGLKQLLADLTEMAIGGGMGAEDFVRRTDIRVRKGMARKNKTEMPKSDLAMIPDGSLSQFWNMVRSGGIPR